MNNETANQLLTKLEDDDLVQNLIAQGDSRYILFNVNESADNFPNYTYGLDEKLTKIALSYLSIGCSYAENQNLQEAIFPLEKGALILENVHSPLKNRSEISSYFILAGSLAFYAAHQYSKSYILLKNVDLDMIISDLIADFLKRDYHGLMKKINKVLLSEDYTNEKIAEIEDEDIANSRVYTLILSKALSSLLEFIYSGMDKWLRKTKEFLDDLLQLISIDGDPSMWWVIRLFRIITDGFTENSLWSTIPPKMGGNNQLVQKYVSAMVFQESPVVELFQAQRVALPKVLNPDGAVVSIPTSSGKTRIAEIAILQSLLQEPDSLILYLAPFRSLAYEIEDSLSKTFSPLGFEVSHLYGGTQFSQLDEMVLADSNITIATHEKAKAILRSNTEMKTRIKLVVIDEGHLLGANNRYVSNEMFLEELRYHVETNEGKMILLSAVLPNSNELAKWITNDSTLNVESKWRPSSERFGLLVFNGNNANITWKGDIESYNRSFINPFWVQKPRSQYLFPNNKKQAVAATAHKLSLLGSVLIYVGRQNMVLSQAREVEIAFGTNLEEHEWFNQSEWEAFKLACEEAYGEESEILRFANYGILCHHAGLAKEVRMSIEKLMRKGNPKIIIATSTLGQGVNIGVSSVIIANVWIDGKRKLKLNDFWNISGRAGRSFIDREGKILFAVDASKGLWTENRDRELAKTYFDIGNQENAVSGLLKLIEHIFRIAKRSGIEFDQLLQLIAENDFSTFKETYVDHVSNLFDLIDDTLLSLNQLFESNTNDDPSKWIDDYFRKSLAYIQSEHTDAIKGEDVILFLKSRNSGVIKMAGDHENWQAFITSSIPLRSGVFIKNEISWVLDILSVYLDSERNIEDLISLLKDIEIVITSFPSEQFENIQDECDLDEFRNLWMKGEPLSLISEKDFKVCNQYFTYSLPWAINGIAKMLMTMELEEEARIFEELAMLVQVGLPNTFGVKIYLAGIKSRVAAVELSKKLDLELEKLTINDLRDEIININSDVESTVNPNTKRWILLLKEMKPSENDYAERIPDFVIEVDVKSKILNVRKYGESYYLCSPEFDEKVKIQVSEKFPFDKFSNDYSVYFERNDFDHWEMKIRSPYLNF